MIPIVHPASDPLAVLSSGARERLPASDATFLPPALATLSDERSLDDAWVLERKLDGIRCLAVARGGAVRLLTRNELDRTAGWPSIAEAVGALGVDCVLDGEVLAMEGEEPLGFGALQQGGRPIALWAFDLLVLDGVDLRPLPQHERRAVLAALLPGGGSGALRLVAELPGPSEGRYAEACASGWEGLIAKRADAPYGGGRSRDWLKLKCLAEQEVVVGGFTEPRGARTGFGALLCGVYNGDVLRYVGKVGTGFGRATLDALTPRLLELERADPPFGEPVKPRPPGTHWVAPELVAQVAFAEWTTAGRLRQPRFLGLRDDKAPRDVVRERP
ncbi:MAG TPA: non-homologous end-joining DNA ligase [Solirubrobacteraceae bacterium]|nr:non-homologous end-joining DNA ligase [Solirubrobacteraceae bacterium]